MDYYDRQVAYSRLRNAEEIIKATHDRSIPEKFREVLQNWKLLQYFLLDYRCSNKSLACFLEVLNLKGSDELKNAFYKIQSNLINPFEMTYPNVLEAELLEISRISLRYFIKEDKVIKSDYIGMIRKINYINGVNLYWQYIIDYLKRSIHYIDILPNDSKQIIEIFKCISRFHPLISVDALKSMKKLDALFNRLSKNIGDATEIGHYLYKCEDNFLEYKEFFSIEKSNISKSSSKLIDKICKTIVAFSNSEGGNLLIGVNNFGCPVGLELNAKKHSTVGNDFPDYEKLDIDIHQQLGRLIPDVYPNINIIKCDYNGMIIYRIFIKKSNIPIYFNGDFIIRAGANCKKLDGEQVQNYIRTRFVNESTTKDDE